MANNRNVYFVSNEGQKFGVKESAARLSKLANTMLGEEEEPEENTEVPLQVSSSALALIVEFLQHLETEPMEPVERPLKSTDIKEVVQEWYATFISKIIDDVEVLVQLAKDADYMDIRPLLDLCVTGISIICLKREPAQLKKLFGIPDAAGEPAAEAKSTEEPLTA